MKRIILALFFLILAPHTAKAADEGLYDPVAPKGSVFIRFMNAAPEDQTFSINGKERGNTQHGGITPYYYTHAGNDVIASKNVKNEIQTQPGEFYTAVLKGDGFIVIKDEAFDNRTKCQIIFYNLGEDKRGLSTADGKVAVIEAVDKSMSGARLINPVSINFAVYSKGEILASTETQSLERGNSYSAVLLQGSDKLVWVKNTIDTRK